MNRYLCSLLMLGLLPSALWAQASSPHIAYVYPAGGQRGTTVEIRLGGQFLNDASDLQVSGKGVTARIIRQTRPLRPQEINKLRERLDQLNEKKEKSTADMKEIESIREQLAKAAIPISPVMAENVFVEMVIAEKAAPGPRELRLQAKTGMSNPVVFDVGELPEFRQEKESFDPEARPRANLARFYKPKKVARESEVEVTLPNVLNSQLMPGDVDHYRFPAKKGQQLVFRTRARALNPYLADAVPGWIQTVLTLYDAEGNEVAFTDDTGNNPDPVMAYKVPRDGEYVLEVHDALYRGREDFVYRIEAGELPHITRVHPLGAQSFSQTAVTLEGWNLPQTSLTLQSSAMKPGLMPLTMQQGKYQTNPVPFLVSTLADFVEKEPNDSIGQAQSINLPVFINGRIEKRGDVDVFQFQGSDRQLFVAEVWARRLESPLDSYLKLTDGEGKVIAFNDDQDDRGQGLMTHHADSRLLVTLPKDGTYYLHVGDVRRHGSSAHAYRLRVGSPRRDFELRITPCSINARPGSSVPVTVYALRRDGFNEEINLFLKDAPRGFALAGGKIPAGQSEIRMTVQVPPTAQPTPYRLEIEGRAWVGSQFVKRFAVPAEDAMQAFAYHHLVPVDDLLVTVSTDARARFPARLLHTQPIKIRAGGTATVTFAIPRGASTDKLMLVLNEPPEGISLKRTSFNNDGMVLELHADSEKVKPGFKTNVIAEVYTDNGKGVRSQYPLGTLPAVPIEILRTSR